MNEDRRDNRPIIKELEQIRQDQGEIKSDQKQIVLNQQVHNKSDDVRFKEIQSSLDVLKDSSESTHEVLKLDISEIKDTLRNISCKIEELKPLNSSIKWYETTKIMVKEIVSWIIPVGIIGGTIITIYKYLK